MGTVAVYVLWEEAEVLLLDQTVNMPATWLYKAKTPWIKLRLDDVCSFTTDVRPKKAEGNIFKANIGVHVVFLGVFAKFKKKKTDC